MTTKLSDQVRGQVMLGMHNIFAHRDRAARHHGQTAEVRRGAILVRSGLGIKRSFDLHHVRAREYKRGLKGICGALTWKQLDRQSFAVKQRSRK